ncbi:PD-(D/E)XK nuclease superfamily protein [Succinivibrio dextrinosolvens]|uniref:PD-(D/E)XK nuclease superfamily protein n=1 Tax=Succinivibrio dextrinosolvens TaxID=83771 RepID=A0A662ZAT0_9GAMM|nr:AAA family ATPase [Succinivibrio dextrinosolvens]SFK25368.1 PD-(D/E)XK nuclease superfamily protein [Succinivibrio dextrinosolvens]
MSKDVLFLTGIEDFSTVIEKNAYYVDKTSYLKELLMSDSEVMNALFIRPRRFGKTLNLDMIRQFCRLNYQNPGDKSYQQKLFVDNGRNLAVAGDDYKEFREKIMGEFPVISISFKTVEGAFFQQAVSQLIYKVGLLYDEFLFLTESSKQDPSDIENFIKNKDFCKTQKSKIHQADKLVEAIDIIGTAIPQIASMLYKEYGRKVIVIIDEYDVPLQKAVIAKEPYYDDMLSIIRTLSGNIFKKDNEPWLYKGIVSGCLRVAHQSEFTDANNFTTFGMNDEPYTGFFGFTEKETEKLLADCGLSDKESEVKEWYDGYRFGNKHIFCPWSLISYCYAATQKDNTVPQPFWVNTSGNDLITMFTDNSMESHNAENIDKLQKLMEGENVDISLMEFTTYPDLRNRVSFDVFMTMMLHTGYVTFAEGSDTSDKVTIRIPNLEILYCFNKKRELLFGQNNPYWYNQALKLVDLLMANNTDEAQMLISSMLKEFLSIRNTGDELYYHGFMIGILGLAAATKNFEYHEEIETGTGFSDIVIDSFDNKTVCILELKKTEKLEDCYDAAQTATKQIIQKDYASKFISRRYKKVYGIGIGFAKKSCEIVSLGNLVEKVC